ncbi:MAG: sialidase family protein, partial [Bacteroidales bacterium]
DEGGTWPVRKTICPGASAYSSLCVLDDDKGTIGIYVEVGEYETYQMYFMSFSLDWLTDGKDHWSPPVGTGKQ